MACRVTLSITTYHPSSLVEVPPLLLPPLSEALTDQQHQQQLDEQQRQVRTCVDNRGKGLHKQCLRGCALFVLTLTVCWRVC
jgi:hypothetical protein